MYTSAAQQPFECIKRAFKRLAVPRALLAVSLGQQQSNQHTAAKTESRQHPSPLGLGKYKASDAVSAREYLDLEEDLATQ